MIEKERITNGQLYCSKDPLLQQEKKRAQHLLKRFNKLLPAQSKKRYSIIKKLFSNVGTSCSIYPPFYCDYGCNITVGNNFLPTGIA